MGRFGISLIVAGILVGVGACNREEPAPAAEPAVEAAPPAVGDTAVPTGEAPAPEATQPVTPGETSPSEAVPAPESLLPETE